MYGGCNELFQLSGDALTRLKKLRCCLWHQCLLLKVKLLIYIDIILVQMRFHVVVYVIRRSHINAMHWVGNVIDKFLRRIMRGKCCHHNPELINVLRSFQCEPQFWTRCRKSGTSSFIKQCDVSFKRPLNKHFYRFKVRRWIFFISCKPSFPLSGFGTLERLSCDI